MFQETFLPAKGSQDTLLVETRLRTGGCRGHTHSRVIPVAGLRTPSLAIGLHSQTEYAAGSSVQIIMTVRHMDGASRRFESSVVTTTVPLAWAMGIIPGMMHCRSTTRASRAPVARANSCPRIPVTEGTPCRARRSCPLQ